MNNESPGALRCLLGLCVLAFVGSIFFVSANQPKAGAASAGATQRWTEANRLDSPECKNAARPPVAPETSCGGRFRALSTVLRDGRVLVLGNDTSAQIFDPLSGHWEPVASTHEAHDSSSSAVTVLKGPACGPDCGKALVVGGTTSELFDPAANNGAGSWTLTDPPVSAVSHPTLTLLKAPGCGEKCGHLLLVGSQLDPIGQVYDPIEKKWTTTAPMTHPRFRHSATLLPDGKVLAAGGYSAVELVVGDPINNPGKTDRSTFSSETYDPERDAWEATGPLKFGRYWHAAALIDGPDCAPRTCGKVLIAGGNNNYQVYERRGELFDPKTRTWDWTGEMHHERDFPGDQAAMLPNGKFLVAGGIWGAEFPGASTSEVYDPATETWTVEEKVQWRRDHVGALFPAGPASVCGSRCGEFLAAGGADEEIYVTAETYRPDPALPQIKQLQPPEGPAAGGTEVKITGFGLGLATSVTFEGEPPLSCGKPKSSACWVDTDDPDRIMYAVTPPHAEGGRVKVTVEVPGLPAADATFNYIKQLPVPRLQSVVPICGPTSGGTQVSVSGSGLTGATRVSFGDVTATTFSVVSDTSIVATSPAQQAGVVALSVEGPGGISVLKDQKFSYPCPVGPTVAPNDEIPAAIVSEGAQASSTQPPVSAGPPTSVSPSSNAIGGGQVATTSPPPGTGPGAPASVLVQSVSPATAASVQSFPTVVPVPQPLAAPGIAASTFPVAEPAPRYSMVAAQQMALWTAILICIVAACFNISPQKRRLSFESSTPTRIQASPKGAY